MILTRQLTKVYPGGVRAVDALDLSVSGGEIFGLLGPNGAGKTTTAGMLTTRVRPTEGMASVAGVDVWKHPAAAKRVIGVVPQSNTLDRSLSARDNLVFHGRFFGMTAKSARVHADEMLEMFRLTEQAASDVMALSGGMAQRLMVARAVMHDPHVLFLDEPSAGLDPQSRIALWEVLRDLHSSGQTILLTTHYMEEADELCDRVAIIDQGKVISIGAPAELKQTLGGDTVVTVQADGDIEQLRAKLCTSVPGAVDATTLEDRVMLTVSGRSGLLPEVMRVAADGGHDVVDLGIHETTLEDVFIELTGRELRD